MDTSQRVQLLTGCTARDGPGAHPPLHGWAQFGYPLMPNFNLFFSLFSRRIRLTDPMGVRITPSVAQRSVWSRFFGRWRSPRNHTQFGGIFPHGTKQRTHSICYILPALCIPTQYYLFQFTPVAFCWIVLWDVQAFMMTCVLTVGTVRVPMMVHGWVSAGRGRGLVSWSFIGGPCKSAGRPPSSDEADGLTKMNTPTSRHLAESETAIDTIQWKRTPRPQYRISSIAALLEARKKKGLSRQSRKPFFPDRRATRAPICRQSVTK